NITGTNDAAVITENAGGEEGRVGEGGGNQGTAGHPKETGTMSGHDGNEGEGAFEAKTPASLKSAPGAVNDDRENGGVHTREEETEVVENVAGSVKGTYGTFTFNETTGAWTYTLDDTRAATQALNQGDPAQDQLVVHSADGTAHTVTVNITGTNDAAVITENA